MAQYVVCPDCGAHLDHGERCDCQKEKHIINIHRNAVFTMLPPKKYTKTLKLQTGGAWIWQIY